MHNHLNKYHNKKNISLFIHLCLQCCLHPECNLNDIRDDITIKYKIGNYYSCVSKDVLLHNCPEGQLVQYFLAANCREFNLDHVTLRILFVLSFI